LNSAAADIHLWLWIERPGDEQLLAPLARHLEAHELVAARAARSLEMQTRALAARTMQRTVLAGYLPGVEPAALRFDIGEHGKPSLAPPFAAHGLHFNLSHTKGLIALAVGRHRDLGVDVENSAERTPALRLARRYFAAAEARDLEQLPPERQPARFFSLWTLKESWMKATGHGLAAGLDFAQFSLDAEQQLTSLSLAAGDEADWRFWQSQPTAAHRLAVALRAPGVAAAATLSTRQWRPDGASSAR
jgi:4'-phosphopantetheinyl transferase